MNDMSRYISSGLYIVICFMKCPHAKPVPRITSYFILSPARQIMLIQGLAQVGFYNRLAADI